MKQNKICDAYGPLKRMTPAEIVRELRKETGLSQAKFGEAYGIPAETIKTWEHGRTNPAEYILRALAVCVREDLKGDKA